MAKTGGVVPVVTSNCLMSYSRIEVPPPYQTSFSPVSVVHALTSCCLPSFVMMKSWHVVPTGIPTTLVASCRPHPICW